MKKTARLFALLLAALMLLGTLPGLTLAATSEEPTDTYCPSERNQHQHYFVEDHRTEPTCTQNGEVVYRCMYCGYQKTQVLAALGHNWGSWKVQTEPTCTEPGVKKHTCKRCGLTKTQSIEPLGHDWGEWHVIKEPTLEAEGLEQHECKRCGIIEQRPIPPLVQYRDYDLKLILDPYDPILYKQYFGDPGGEGDPAWVFVDAKLINVGSKAVLVQKEWDGLYGEVDDVYAPTWLQPGEVLDVNYLLVCWNQFIDTSSAHDDVVGTVRSDWYFIGYDNGEPVCLSNTVVMEWTVIDDELITGWEIPDDTAVFVEKWEDSTPANPNGYQLGESICYVVAVENVGGETIDRFYLIDCSSGEEEDRKSLYEQALEPGQIVYFGYDHIVTMDDVLNHYVENIAYVEWGDEELGNHHLEPSNTVIVPTINKANILLTKSEKSTPANGLFYVEGEEVVFEIYVKNNTPVHVHDLTIHDTPALGDLPVTTIEDVGPGEDGTYEVHYTVTAYDAEIGYFGNVSWASGEDEYGNPIFVYSNDVEVPCGSEAYDVIWDLAIVKEEVSKPTNGEYYEEGETIEYKITVTNTGEVKIVEGIVYDWLKKEGFGEIGAFENLMPGNSRTYTYKYTVTKDDVDVGNVVNYAYSYWTIDDDEAQNYYESESNEVWSKCGDTIPGLIPPVRWQLSEGEDYCVRTLLLEGEMAASYSLHLCSTHDALADELNALIEEAENTNEAAILAAWKIARVKWAEELEKMYEAAYAAANYEARTAVLREKNAFYAYVDAYEKLRKGDEIEAWMLEREIAELLMNRCADLCYDLHKAGEPRPDSVFAEHETLNETMDYPKCVNVVIEIGESDANYGEILCTDHRDVIPAQNALLEAAESPSARVVAWKRTQKLWQVELDQMVNAAYKNADADTKKLIAAERIALDKLVEARQAYLECLYAEEVAAELIAHLFKAEVLFECDRMK
ncbi:MAG: hypothetical protein IJP98_03840 [Clostridia bacterium]|nr:hypothetical protein [Clostridia bacterium]